MTKLKKKNTFGFRDYLNCCFSEYFQDLRGKSQSRSLRQWVWEEEKLTGSTLAFSTINKLPV